MQKAGIQINKRQGQSKKEMKIKEFFHNVRHYHSLKGVRKRNYPLTFFGGTISAFSYLYQFEIIIFDIITYGSRLPLNSYITCVGLSAMGMLGFCLMHKGVTEYWI
ncbi:MAG: hypothetical protein PHW96_02065 [Candidatus Nanoarchaeia archaeon]|nr:hypothetical protein [Candidatus Nanoarchaeia archaeon]